MASSSSQSSSRDNESRHDSARAAELELNDELNVAVTSRELAARLLQDFERDLQVSQRLELNAWRDRSLLMKARERFWSAFSEVF